MASAAIRKVDLIVIGGGSGGLAAAKEAARLNKSVLLFDFVKPSTQGTKWGFGGTCVNVGCVPKKLMHYAALLGASMHDMLEYGWKIPARAVPMESGLDEQQPAVEHDWSRLVTTVQNYVRSLNFNYRSGVRSAKVEYVNALAQFVDPSTVTYTLKGETTLASASHFIIATGGRPTMPMEIPGVREHAISSDDVFSLPSFPGKTLCVGASYIALETAGFLNKLHCDVTVAARSILLRGFDRQISEKIGVLMAEQGVGFKYGALPTQLTRESPESQINVTFSDGTSDSYDTVFYAIGRTADTSGIGLDLAGVKTAANGKIPVVHEQTNVPHIFAIGDIVYGTPELTPVAIKAGELLARRLFAGATQTMDYALVPTAVFTPFEYGCVGLNEEDAVAKYGEDNVEVYLFEFTTLELQAAHRHKHVRTRENEYDTDMGFNSMSKIICLRSENERVIGFHFLGPNAGEITQGYSLALRLGATKSDFDSVVGIHPTDAESFCNLNVTKRSGEPYQGGGCGGGKCG